MVDNKKYRDELISKSYNFSLKVIKFIGSLSRSDLSNEVMGRQLLRSSTSIGANIVEAQAASSKRDFINFLGYGLKSANETKYWLGLLRDSGRVNKEAANNLLQVATELGKLLGSSVLALKKRK